MQDHEPASKREEKYNTRFLVANLKRDLMRPRLIAATVVAVLAGAIVLWLLLAEPAAGPLAPGGAPVPATSHTGQPERPSRP